VRAKIDHAVRWGTVSPDAQTKDVENDAQTFDVENNVWALGDVTGCVVLDVPRDVPTILDVVGSRQVRPMIATHGHDDHVRAAEDTVVHPGHGSDTTIGTEAPDLQGRIVRGH
jgi:glyoxylase-like metal-dependent hydrolase (beta-lactamase superfamily II)